MSEDKDQVKAAAGNGICIECGGTANLGEYYCGACWFNKRQMIDRQTSQDISTTISAINEGWKNPFDISDPENWKVKD